MDDENAFSKSILKAMNCRADELSVHERWDALVELISMATKRALQRNEVHESKPEKEDTVRDILSSVDG